MQALLKLLLFFTFLTTGTSLECETCSALGTNCSGPVVLCEANKETCLVSFTVSNVDGATVKKTEKGCDSTFKCTFPPIYFNMGHGKIYRSHWVCCTGEACKTAVVKLPPVIHRSNGKQCPGCHAWSESCMAEMVNCTGWDTECFEMASHSESSNGSHIDRTMMGCTNKFVCITMETERSQFWFGTSSVQRAQCKPGSSHGSQPTSLLFLLSFSAILLMEILS